MEKKQAFELGLAPSGLIKDELDQVSSGILEDLSRTQVSKWLIRDGTKSMEARTHPWPQCALMQGLSGMCWAGSGIWRPELESGYVKATLNANKFSLLSPGAALFGICGCVNVWLGLGKAVLVTNS